jgi:hypothetical protein
MPPPADWFGATVEVGVPSDRWVCAGCEVVLRSPGWLVVPSETAVAVSLGEGPSTDVASVCVGPVRAGPPSEKPSCGELVSVAVRVERLVRVGVGGSPRNAVPIEVPVFWLSLIGWPRNISVVEMAPTVTRKTNPESTATGLHRGRSALASGETGSPGGGGTELPVARGGRSDGSCGSSPSPGWLVVLRVALIRVPAVLKDAVYTAAATLETTEPKAAPNNVPVTPKNDAATAVVMAAKAPPTILVKLRSSLDPFVSVGSVAVVSLAVPFVVSVATEAAGWFEGWFEVWFDKEVM